MKSLFLCLSIFMVSCSSSLHQKAESENVPHEHNISENKKVAYEGKCATGVLHKNCNVKASNDIFFDHRNVRYFFSSEEAKNQFVKDIDRNILKSDKNWEERGGRAADRL